MLKLHEHKGFRFIVKHSVDSSLAVNLITGYYKDELYSMDKLMKDNNVDILIVPQFNVHNPFVMCWVGWAKELGQFSFGDPEYDSEKELPEDRVFDLCILKYKLLTNKKKEKSQ
jgi:hypothetical protein